MTNISVLLGIVPLTTIVLDRIDAIERQRSLSDLIVVRGFDHGEGLRIRCELECINPYLEIFLGHIAITVRGVKGDGHGFGSIRGVVGCLQNIPEHTTETLCVRLGSMQKQITDLPTNEGPSVLLSGVSAGLVDLPLHDEHSLFPCDDTERKTTNPSPIATSILAVLS